MEVIGQPSEVIILSIMRVLVGLVAINLFPKAIMLAATTKLYIITFSPFSQPYIHLMSKTGSN